MDESSQIYFKGGTAIKFLFGSFRFSEDLDFSSVLEDKAVEFLVQRAVKDLSRELPVFFKKEKTVADSFSGRIFQDISDFKFPLTIRLDISLKERPIYTETNYIETNFPIAPFPLVR
ncbi:unnamed protein product, partial [marine sediment metagenome]